MARKRQRKPIKFMKKSNSVILFIVSALVFIGAIAAFVCLNK